MTCSYLFDLRKDSKVKNLPQMTPISCSGQIKCLIVTRCNVKILPILAHPTVFPAEK